MKALLFAIPCLLLASCASLPYGHQAADYNRDGLVSDAEYVQYNKQRDVQDRNVYSESVRRRNVTNTVRDAADTLYHARRAQNLWNAF